jgi:PhnB protein
MALLNPYFQFDGTAREAMETSHAIFGGDLQITTFGEYGAHHADGRPPADGVMHAMLTCDVGTIMASDLPPHMSADDISNGNVSVSGDEAETLREWFRRLAEGGEVTTPLEKQMWGDEFGTCTDRFGVGWMVDIRSAEG